MEEGDEVLAALGLSPKRTSAEFQVFANHGGRGSWYTLGTIGLTMAPNASEVTMVLESGERFDIPIVRRKNMSYDAERIAQAALIARARESLAAFTRGDVPDVSARVARLGRTKEAWLEQLRDRHGTFRTAPIRSDDLWEIVENPAAEVTARAGART